MVVLEIGIAMQELICESRCIEIAYLLVSFR